MLRHRLLGSRIASALFAGAAVGAATVAVTFNLPYMLEVGRWDMFLVAMTFIVAFMVWLLGLAVIGAPLWRLAERLGYRSFTRSPSGSQPPSLRRCSLRASWTAEWCRSGKVDAPWFILVEERPSACGCLPETADCSPWLADLSRR